MKLRHTIADRVAGFVRDWSLPRQFAGEDPTREAAQSTMSRRLRPRLEEADTIGTSTAPIARSGALSWFMPRTGTSFTSKSTRAARSTKAPCVRREQRPSAG